ncbi:glycoside hydrolase family 31 protein [Pontibacter beigongshangensis]|uniref:glycoside hydrolase family 31 protein n=1 Tax=Pontibacter beigongshangensis TaxID=2574733 RepID=UPI0016508F42|nr:TIM-barrel domain-containing protein [Pontibacter beigongshangensis]
MKKYLLLFLYTFLSLSVYAQKTQQSVSPGKCTSYTVNGNKVIFNCENGSKVQLQLCSRSVVKVWYEPIGEFKRTNESFAVVNEQLEEMGTLQVNEQPQAYELFTDFLRIRVNKEPFQLHFFDKYQKPLLSDFKDKGLVKEGDKLVAYKAMKSDEQFFGLGEKAGPLNKRGRSYKMWNSDQPCYGAAQDPLYKSIPFFMSSYNYGIFFDNTYKSEFKFGTESSDYYSFEAPGGEMLYYFIFGNNYKQIIQNYIQLTGQPIMPPKWALGFSQSRGLYKSEQQAREIAAEFRMRQIPNDIMYQDIGWVQGLQDFDWKKNNYSDPAKMVKDLEAMGFKMIISQDPVISQANEKQWREADSLGFLTTDTRTGKSYNMPWPWGGDCGVVDFTKPGVADWWGKYQQKPLNDGVRGFWTDMGEPAWSNEDATDRLYMKHHLGMHDEIHNVYGLTWDKIVTEQFEKHNPNQRIFQMTRAAYAGLQRYTFGWSGDAGNGNNVLDGWHQLANQIPLSLSAGMGGIPFWACDISGYCGDITDYPAMAELYVRWLQFGVMNPLSRAHHEGDNAVEPWRFGKEAERISKKAIELKYRLFPYIYTYAREAHDTGVPLMRALLLEYPNDPETFKTDGQYLFGRELLVAPVVEKGATSKRVYLPEGEWIDFNDGKTSYKGSRWIDYEAPLEVTPLFVKRGAIIPMMPVMQYIHEQPVYPVSLEIFPAVQNQQATFALYEDDGETNDYKKSIYSKTRFSCATTKEGYDVKVHGREENGYKVPGSRNYVLKLHLEQKPKSVLLNGKKVKTVKQAELQKSTEADMKSLLWSWNKESGVCSIKVPDTGKEVQVLVVK